MGKVFFVQEPARNKVDISTAEAYGDITFVFAKKDPVSLAPSPSYQKARQALADFNPEEDYLSFCGGDQMATAVAVAVLAQRGITNFKWLRWDRYNGGSYQPSWVGIGNPDRRADRHFEGEIPRP